MYDRIMDDDLPKALMMGVDYELFWTLNPKSLTPFVKAFEMKEKQLDTMAWVNGIYMRMAIVSAMNKDAKFPSRPFSDNVGNTESAKIDKTLDMKLRFMAKATQLNSRFNKKEVNNNE